MTDSLPSYKCPFGMNKDQDILWRLQKRFQYFQKQKKKKSSGSSEETYLLLHRILIQIR